MNLARNRPTDLDTAPKTGIASAGRKLGGYAEGHRRPDIRLKD